MSLQEQNHALKELYMYYICLNNTNNQLSQFMRFYYYSQPLYNDRVYPQIIRHLTEFLLYWIQIHAKLSTLVKSVYQKVNFLISQPKHMFWVLKRTVSMRQFF